MRWGHMHVIVDQANTKHFDGLAGPSDTGFHGGTILQSTHQFRVAARNGTWVAAKAFIDDNLTGYVVHHESESGIDILRRYCVREFFFFFHQRGISMFMLYIGAPGPACRMINNTKIARLFMWDDMIGYVLSAALDSSSIICAIV